MFCLPCTTLNVGTVLIWFVVISLLILSMIASPDFLILFTSSSFLPNAIFSASCGSAAIHNFGLG